MAKSQDWKYVMVVSGATENPDGITLSGPFEDKDAADEFCEDYLAITAKTPLESDPQLALMVASLDDPDDVLGALKADRKAAKKAQKKAAKKAAKAAAKAGTQVTEVEQAPEPTPEPEGNGKKGKKGKKGKAAASTTEADASDAAAPSSEGAAPVAATTEAATANGQPDPDEAEQARRNAISAAAAKMPWAGQLADRKDEWIETWSREMTKNEVIGPLNLSVQQRRVIAALKWEREVARANAHMGGPIPPAPIIGMDANGRIVVQGLTGPTRTVKQWAVFKNGNPTEVKEPVTRLKAKAAEAV